jgi:hypothetical protein
MSGYFNGFKVCSCRLKQFELFFKADEQLWRSMDGIIAASNGIRKYYLHNTIIIKCLKNMELADLPKVVDLSHSLPQ